MDHATSDEEALLSEQHLEGLGHAAHRPLSNAPVRKVSMQGLDYSEGTAAKAAALKSPSAEVDAYPP